MVIVLDILLFFSLVLLLVAIIMQNDKNKKHTLKLQAFSCIASLAFELVILVIRFLFVKYWGAMFIVLIVHSILSIPIILDARDYGAFEKKKKEKKINADVVV